MTRFLGPIIAAFVVVVAIASLPPPASANVEFSAFPSVAGTDMPDLLNNDLVVGLSAETNIENGANLALSVSPPAVTNLNGANLATDSASPPIGQIVNNDANLATIANASAVVLLLSDGLGLRAVQANRSSASLIQPSAIVSEVAMASAAVTKPGAVKLGVGMVNKGFQAVAAMSDQKLVPEVTMAPSATVTKPGQRT